MSVSAATFGASQRLRQAGAKFFYGGFGDIRIQSQKICGECPRNSFASICSVPLQGRRRLCKDGVRIFHAFGVKI